MSGVQVLPLAQVWQATPKLPQLELLVPPRQVFPLQQPLQFDEVQVGVVVQVPPPNPVGSQVWFELQVVQAWPPKPQVVLPVPVRQVLPLQQPVQFDELQVCAVTHWPPPNPVAWQVWFELQLVHAWPAEPQEDALVPVRQVLPLQQPLQVSALQGTPESVPPSEACVPPSSVIPPSASAVTQDPSIQVSPVPQLMHTLPPAPHWPLVLPGLQRPNVSRQPSQVPEHAPFSQVEPPVQTWQGMPPIPQALLLVGPPLVLQVPPEVHVVQVGSTQVPCWQSDPELQVLQTSPSPQAVRVSPVLQVPSLRQQPAQVFRHFCTALLLVPPSLLPPPSGTQLPAWHSASPPQS